MPRCKCCREKFENKYFLQKYCLKNDDCIKAAADFSIGVVKKEKKKVWEAKKRKLRPHLYPKKYKSYLQDEINKLARAIDNKFLLRCIDCDRPFAAQQDAGHFNSVGKNATIRFNLHNIHSQRSECNQNGLGGGRERQYFEGLIKRYGQPYAIYVDVGIQKEFKYIGLSPKEVEEKLKLVRQINRDFDSYVLEGPLQARTLFNNLIGIYRSVSA